MKKVVKIVLMVAGVVAVIIGVVYKFIWKPQQTTKTTEK